MVGGCYSLYAPRTRMLVAAAQLPLPAPQPRRRDQPQPTKALAAILRSRVIACLRAQDGETARQAAHAAVRGGISVLEIVMSTPGVLEVVEDLRRSYPSLTFGVGTVINADDAKKAIRAGAQFLMSPGTVLDILRDLEESEILYIPGVLTPTEVISACDAGAKVVKVYPVSVMGGEMYMSALKKPFPFLPMVASQGITIGSIKSYMEAGASAVVLSDAIFDKKLMGEEFCWNFIARKSGHFTGIAVRKMRQNPKPFCKQCSLENGDTEYLSDIA